MSTLPALSIVFLLLLSSSRPAGGQDSSWFTGTYAGDGNKGFANGKKISSEFASPSDIVVDGRGTAYIADADNSCIRTISATQVVGTLPAPPNLLQRPTGLAYDFASQTLFIADQQADAIFAVQLGASGQFGSVSSKDDDDHAGGQPSQDPFSSSDSPPSSTSSTSSTTSSPAIASFVTVFQNDPMISNPHRIALHASGHLIVTTADKHTVYFVLLGCDPKQPLKPCACRVAFMGLSFPGGSCVFPIGAESTSGFRDGPASDALFSFPVGLATSSDGLVYVADSGNNAVRVIALYHSHESDSMNPQDFWQSLAASRVVTLVGGPGVSAADDEEQRLTGPRGLAINDQGLLYIADTMGHRVVTLDTMHTSVSLTTIAGSGSPGYADGKNAQFDLPTSLALMNKDLVLVVDPYRNVVRSVALYHIYSGFDKHPEAVLLYLPYIIVSSLVALGVVVFAGRKLYLARRLLPAYRRVQADSGDKAMESYLESNF